MLRIYLQDAGLPMASALAMAIGQDYTEAQTGILSHLMLEETRYKHIANQMNPQRAVSAVVVEDTPSDSAIYSATSDLLADAIEQAEDPELKQRLDDALKALYGK